MHIKQVVEFGEWLERRSMDKSWITVAQHDVSKRDGYKVDLFMTSVLAPPGSDGALLINSQWLASNDFGRTDVWEDGGQVLIEEQTEAHVGKNEDVRIEPFTFLRLWNDTWPSKFELIQNFILFYNLHFDTTDNKYVAVNAAGDATDVVKIRDEAQRRKIDIRTEFLRNYLACRERILVRQHDNYMYFDRTLAEFGIEPFRGRRLADSDYVFDLAAVDADWMDGRPAISVLNGKDLILPFDKRQDILRRPKKNSEFITGVDDHGDYVMASYKKGDGPMDFLTGVYFKREVLQRYYDTPDYKVELHMVSGSTWCIKKYTNNADLIHVHLGDLVSLPEKEQRYWRNSNVPPEDGDPDEQFVDSDTLVYRFKESLRRFQGGFETQFGFRPFLSLRTDDAYKEDSIRVPLNDGPDELEKQFNYLALLLPNSIDEEQLREYMGTEKCKRLKKGRSITVLEALLKHESLPTDIIPLLREVQDLRSSANAHRKGREYTKNAKKYGLNETSGKEFIRKLLMNMTEAFDGLI